MRVAQSGRARDRRGRRVPMWAWHAGVRRTSAPPASTRFPPGVGLEHFVDHGSAIRVAQPPKLALRAVRYSVVSRRILALVPRSSPACRQKPLPPTRSAATSASSASSASRTRSRISSSSRCRRCSRCCASSSTCRGRCSACWSACSTPRAASRSSARDSRSTASARGRCCCRGWACWPAAPCSRRSHPAPTGCFPIAALMGVGNGVFHPADFAILNANVAPRRLGYAYSTHGVGGNLGYALAPIVSYALAAAFNWRIALACMGVAGMVALACSRRSAPTSRRIARPMRTRTRSTAAWRCSCSRRSCSASRYFFIQTTAIGRACRRSCRPR